MEIGTNTPDNLLAGDFPLVTDWLSIPVGILKRGTVLTSDGEAMEAGGEPFAVLAEDVDASGGAKQAPIFLTGEFIKNCLLLSGGDAVSDAADIAALRALSIFAKASIPAA